MTELQITDAFRELVARGLMAAQPAPQPLPRGNVDRKPELVRGSWLVVLPAGNKAKLTLGGDLSSLADRQAAFAEACPAIAKVPLVREHLPAGDALLESYFDGTPLETVAVGRLLPPVRIRQAVTGICDTLAASELPSSESARAAEWSSWTGRLLALPVWSPAEITSLKDLLLPALYPRLTAGPAVTRWTNGDFLPANILLNANGESRLIDAEFAARTHFFAEDAVRFHVLSPVVQDQPDLFAGLLPARDLPWHLYFWLRQFQLEIEQNTPAYLARFKAARLALIRRLAEHVLGAPLPGWSTATMLVNHRLEDIRWQLDHGKAVQVSGWCHVPDASRLRTVSALGRTGPVASGQPIARPDVQQHFGGEARALPTGFSLAIPPNPGNFPVTLCAVVDHGTLVPFHVITGEDLPGGALSWEDYPAWAARHDPDPAAPSSVICPLSSGSPLFSILLPVYQTPESCLRDCIVSVLAQRFSRWELCVVDDGSGSPSLGDRLGRFAAADPRIRIKTRPQNGGISRATNDALAMAQGEFVILLDHDDLLRPHALDEFAAELGRRPDLDAIYSDEDKIAADGQRILPLLKPDFSPEFLRGVMYAGHALCVRTIVARAVGGFDPRFDGVQDYEFLLRVTEKTKRIGHIPRILYHWRQSPGSSALHGNVKGNMDERQAAAVQAHLQRTGDPRRAAVTGGHRVRLEATSTPTVEIVRIPDPTFAVAALRQAATTCAAEILVLLSVEPREIADACLGDLAALAALPDSGCVAPVLLSADGRVYESGQVGSVSIMRGFHAGSDGYHGSLRCNREVDALSPACIAVRRLLAADAPADEDWSGFCARLRGRGLYHRVCASARVQLSVSSKENPGPVFHAPVAREFYNPHFDSNKGDYTLAPAASDRALPEAGLQFHVDQPVDWDILPRCLICRGWCFSGEEIPVSGIRLRIADRVLVGVVGLSRPDVRTARPDAPDEFTGFEIRGTLPSGRHQANLEARLSDGTWTPLAAYSVSVQHQILPLWLGGGDWMELMFFQMPAHMAYPARPVCPEKFPAAKTGASHPIFSIVTPSYNQARFLPETMRSVLGQVGIDCSYVVQDGGSTDGSRELIASFVETGGWRPETGIQDSEHKNQKSVVSDLSPASSLQSPASSPPPVSGLRSPVRPRLLHWSSEPDSGQADAIAKGFAKTSGGPDDIMAWINSDDFYLPGTLAFVADYFARHPDVDVVYGHRVVVDEDSQEIGRWFLPKHDDEVLRLNDFVPQETLFWRRRIWDQAGGIDPSFKFALDWDLLLRFQSAGAKIVRVPYFLACFRVHAAQKTSARMHDVGQKEITLLRERTHGRPFPPQELEQDPRLLRYLRRSAFIEWLWKMGIRAP